MSSGKSKTKTTTEVKIPDEFRGAYDSLGQGTQQIVDDILSSGGRVIPGFTGAQNKALNLANNLGVDPALGQAAGMFRNNPGVGALQGINVNQAQQQALAGLEGFDSTQLRGVGFDALKNFDSSALKGLDFNQLKQTAGGDFLDVGNNPYLQEALQNAQRLTTEQFTQNVQPALAAQFGGGFGLTGSASINAQRGAAEDLSRALSEQATSTLANQYNLERGFQEDARSLLANLQFGRAGQIDQNALSRANSLGQLQLEKAAGIDQNALNQQSQLGQLGLGFTQADIQRGTNMGNLQNQAAAGLMGVGNARNEQRLQQVNTLFNLGEQQRSLRERQANTAIDDTLARLGQAGSIIGLNSGQQTSQSGGGGSAAGGVLGGALSGGALGFGIGGPIGGTLGAIGGGILGAF